MQMKSTRVTGSALMMKQCNCKTLNHFRWIDLSNSLFTKFDLEWLYELLVTKQMGR